MIHTVKGFGIVNKAEVDVFLELSCFVDGPTDVGNLTSGSSSFYKSSLYIWKFLVHVLLKPSLENFEHYFASMRNECNCTVVSKFFGAAFLWDWNENWPLPVLWPGHCWVFQICWHIECSTFTASSFRIWNSSAGIPLSLLALFVVMLPKAHLTSHSRMSGSRSMITPSWLFGSLRSFLYSSSVYSCHLFLISSASAPCSSTTCKESPPFPADLYWHLCQTSCDHMCGAYFCTYSSATWISPVQQALLTRALWWVWPYISSTVFLFFKIIMGMLSPLHFHLNFSISSLTSTIKLLRFWISMALFFGTVLWDILYLGYFLKGPWKMPHWASLPVSPGAQNLWHFKHHATF